MMWARKVCGPAIGGTPLFGELNHSRHFIYEFTQSLKRAVDFSTYASMHALVPATGMASDLTRVIDIVTIGGVSLLVILHVLTDPTGKLVWHVLGCPAVDGRVGGDSSADITPAGGGKSSFRFHSAAHLTQLVHTCEASFGITKASCQLRLALTLGDGAICGPGSIGFVKHEAALDGDRFNVLREGVCAFHAADNAAGACERSFEEAMLHDKFLRLVHAGFAWGTGRFILKALAREFHRLTAVCVESSDRMVLAASQADAQGDFARRDRLLRAASRKRAEAQAQARKTYLTPAGNPMKPAKEALVADRSL